MAILGWIIAVLALPGFLVVLYLKDDEGKLICRKWSWAVLTLFMVGVLFTMLATVPRGHVGVEILFRAVTGEYRTQGLQLKSPVVKLKIINVQTQKYEVEATAASQDLQDVATTIALNYHLDPAGAAEMYRSLGEDYIEKLAAPAVQETVKKITANYLAEELILKRPIVKADIQEDLAARLLERGIITEYVSITNFQFSTVFSESIEAKVAAQQAVFEAENKLLRVMVEAKQAEEAAIGRANAVVAESEGQAEAIKIVTAAQVKANEDITLSLNPEILRYIMLDRFGDNIQIWVVPEGQDMVLPAPTQPDIVIEPIIVPAPVLAPVPAPAPEPEVEK